jgi:alpha-glucosidase
MLKPYFKQLEEDYQLTGKPIIRPTFFHYDLVKEDCFLVGKDLYVCPVMHKRKTKQVVTFPTDGWVHLFTDELYNKGTQLIDAPIGCPPVFYKENSSHKKLFMRITNYIGDTQ